MWVEKNRRGEKQHRQLGIFFIENLSCRGRTRDNIGADLFFDNIKLIQHFVAKWRTQFDSLFAEHFRLERRIFDL